MTPKAAFESGGRNPENGLLVRDWYALGCIFSETPVSYEGTVLFGFRSLGCIDVASNYYMEMLHLPKPPEFVCAEEVIDYLTTIFTKYGPPRIGVVVSHSVWLSSSEMLLDEDTMPRGEFLEKNGIHFDPMPEDHKLAIRSWLTKQGLRCEFDGDNIR